VIEKEKKFWKGKSKMIGIVLALVDTSGGKREGVLFRRIPGFQRSESRKAAQHADKHNRLFNLQNNFKDEPTVVVYPKA